ncbi:hypothetical protein EYC84_001716 [Monilinia fructicola]|uniref:NIF system FeS cluster assembly NifU N-terminal domain-containing protein n=1 Tax=Monilinia fructicola TaxID=38448 RepID=A0A5M9JSZ7_MONFR|nr:hypothetical protein EYC84_001716 [Monilinia fructicola]
MQMITWDHGQSYPKFNKHSKFNQPRSQSSNQTHPSSNPSYQYKQSSKYTNTFNININPHQILYLTLSTHRHIIKFHLSSTFQSPLTSHITKMFRRAFHFATRPISAQIALPSFAAGRRSYHEKVLDHYSRPRNVGSMSKTDTDVGTGLVGAPACGDVMKLQIRVDPDTNTISDVKFKTFGCGSAIASSSYLTELVRGMTLEEAGRVRNTEIAKELCLPPVKRRSTQIISI